MTAVRIGVVTVSDRASRGEYEDRGGPAIEAALGRILASPWVAERRIVPDEQPLIEAALRELADVVRCPLIVTTGGTGPAPRDVTPEATRAVAHRELPGFGEQMRQVSLRAVPTAILSRQVAVIRGRALIVNLPGRPAAIRETLEGPRSPDGSLAMPGIFAAVPYCLDLIGGPYVDTHAAVVAAFRPASARRR